MNHLLNRSLEQNTAIEVVYLGKSGEITQRSIIVKAINETYVKAFCLKKRQARIFKKDSILAAASINERGIRYAY